MDEQQVRELVREALARHLGSQTGLTAGRDGSLSRPSPHDGPGVVVGPTWKTHLSHGRFVFLAPSEPDAPCIVEPHVRCHHCGFCQSYGH